ncbi:hypothetical protein BH11MYX3_BH11MYX3_06810 [soil metagenome]
MSDTTPEAAEVQRRILRGMTAARKVELLSEMCEDSRTIAIAGIRTRHPDYDDQHARWALWRMLYGDQLFRRAWPSAPLLAP